MLRRRTLLIALFALLWATTAHAAKTVAIPAVTGMVTDQDGNPLQNCLVVVTFIGSHQSVDNTGGDVLKLCVTHSMSEPDGTFALQAEDLILKDIEGNKVHFIGARVEFNHTSCKPLRMDIANLSNSGSGVISVFLTGALEHEGGFFSAISAGWQAVKGNKFVKQYKKSLETSIKLELKEPATPTEPPADNGSGEAPTNRRLRQFRKLYKND